jgi:hypothetical protein
VTKGFRFARHRKSLLASYSTEVSSAAFVYLYSLLSLTILFSMPRATNAVSTEFSRERNRIHARRTRQRKKEHTNHLQSLADELKDEQLRLKQIITEKNTANILLGLFSKSSSNGDDATNSDDPRIDELLLRPTEDIPNASLMSEILPPLILPGQHASKKMKEAAPLDGIDYDLLGKDRSQCSSHELEQIRRERNRMHAKRTRDRKRLFMGSMMEVCKALEEENDVLRAHLRTIDPDHKEFEREPTRTATVLLTTTIKPSKKKITPKTTLDESTLISASETSTPAHSPNLVPLATLSTAEYLNLNTAIATPIPNSCPLIQGALLSSLLEAALLEETNRKRPCPTVSSDDSNDDEASAPSGATKRARIVEL